MRSREAAAVVAGVSSGQRLITIVEESAENFCKKFSDHELIAEEECRSIQSTDLAS